ncbi:glycine--tRNA ligase [Deltaproteobacteria bacterium PRO3]|nr:glycine--tRNA ligase [Deltaproteobacteria bacterium PRO3]
MEKLVSLAKRRGFIFQSSEIYGGINGFWDYGPVGVELRNNIKNFWWQRMVRLRDDVVGVDTSIICHPQTWVASGHVASFSDPMVDCKTCKGRFRADHIEAIPCPQKPSLTVQACAGDKKGPGELTEVRQFNLMFETFVGALRDDSARAYLRPETCQSIFTQFKNVQIVSRQKIPFGIAQIGKSFRNEITPRNFIFRSREFEQMEMEFFVKPEESEMQKWYEYWVAERFQWFQDLGIKPDKLRQRIHSQDELAHYAKGCVDVEYEFPFGWSELEGIANRSNYDLSQHIKTSGKDLSYFDETTKEKYVPAVVETSLGVDRTLLTVLADAYAEDVVEGEERVVMRFSPAVAPYKVAVFPLSRKLAEPAMALEKSLRKRYVTDYDDVGSIGKRYRRHDEIGTPLAVTYDFQSEEDKQVTVRDRDSTKQERIAIDRLEDYLKDHLKL